MSRKRERLDSDAELAAMGLTGSTAVQQSLRLKIEAADFWAIHAATDAQRAEQKARAATLREQLATMG